MVEIIITFILGTFTFVVFSVKCMTVFQQCGYKLSEFYSYTFIEKKKEILRLSTYSLVFLLLSVVTAVIFKSNRELTFSIFLVLTVFLSALFIFKIDIIKQPVLTGRFLRILILSGIFSGVICAIVCYVLQYFGLNLLPFIGVCIAPVECPLIIAIGWCMEFPYSKTVYFLGIKRCTKRLERSKDLIKIGITGSYGKTTTKNFLYKMLSVKYRVLVTPESYNTPLGICKTVQGELKNYDVFIAEMGARRKDDIKTLCKIVKPNIGIITGITYQHSKTLGDIEQIKLAKNQLIDGLIGEKYAVFSSDCPNSADLYEKAECPKILSGMKSKTGVRVKNAVQTADGIEFEIILKEKVYKTFTPLIGLHNLTDICLSASVAMYLGVKEENILSVIPTLKSPPHRAELIKTANGITVIDDGYNANFYGIKSTAEAIGVFDGYKIAVTSGVVELGKEAEEVNINVGKVLADNFDFVIAVGANADYICEGVKFDKFRKVETLSQAREIIKKTAKSGSVVAFFNDIPDRY